MKRFFFALLLFAPLASAAPEDDAQTKAVSDDWQAVLALDAGPREAMTSREEARAVALAFLLRQESALRKFIDKHPDDAHAVDAQLRLAHLLSTRSDLIGAPEPFQAGLQLLDDALKTAPEPRRADLAFARIALAMHRVTVPTDSDRAALTTQMLAFQAHYPNDSRVAALLAEIATLFDQQSRRKEILLKQALQAAHTDELRARIGDDLKRLAMLGQKVTVQGSTADGAPMDTAQLRGKVVLVYFFASWSAPSLAGLEEVEYLRKTFSEDQLGILGVSLDPTKEALEAVTKEHGIEWPVIRDEKGRGWESPIVRSLAINALPTLWILDKRGNLRTLNAQVESEALVRRLLKEP